MSRIMSDDDMDSTKSEKPEESKPTSKEEVTSRRRTQYAYPYQRVAHPFLCRLNESAAFTVTAPNAMIAAGFASMGMGLFTLFRPTPVLLFTLAFELNAKSTILTVTRDILLVTTVLWEGLLMFVLIVLGLVLTFSVRIKKRSVLLIHPWALMVLYLDVVVWLTMTLTFHLQLSSSGPLNSFFRRTNYPLAYFSIIYIDSVVFCLLHYTYATYFIAAELSVIERCY